MKIDHVPQTINQPVNNAGEDHYDLGIKIDFRPTDVVFHENATASATCKGTCESCGVTCKGTCAGN